MKRFSSLIGATALLFAVAWTVVDGKGSCSDKESDPCVWTDTCPTCTRLAIDVLTMIALPDVHNPKAIYQPGAQVAINVTGKVNLPPGETITAGSWKATFYEDGRVEPKIYTLTGDITKALTIHNGNIFNLYVHQGTFQTLQLPPQLGSGNFRVEFSGSDQDHVDDFYTELDYKFAQQK